MKITGIITLMMLAAQMAFAGMGEINGRIVEASNGEPVMGVIIYVEVDSQVVYQGVTDENGFYVIKPIATGTYDVRVSSLTFSQQLLKDISVSDGQTRKLDFKLSVNVLDEVIVTVYKDLVDPGYPIKITIVGAPELEKSAASPIDFIGGTSNVFQADYGAPIQFRGAREDATLYMVDGMRIIGEPGLIRNSIDDMVIYSGGIPAKYGDATGGVIVITTKSYKKLR